MKHFNLLITVLHNSDNIRQQITDEMVIANHISQLLYKEGVKFAIGDDFLIDECLKQKNAERLEDKYEI